VDNTKDIVLMIGLLVNFLGVLFAIFSSRIKLERRMAVVETYIKVLVRKSEIKMRETDSVDDYEENVLR